MVVAGSEDAQVVGGSDGGTVGRSDVADGGAVARESGLLDVVTGRGTGEEALVADDSINIGGGSLQEVEEGTTVESGLLESEIELDTLVIGGGQELENGLSLEALGKRVGQLNLGVKSVGSVPGLSQGEACAVVYR